MPKITLKSLLLGLPAEEACVEIMGYSFRTGDKVWTCFHFEEVVVETCEMPFSLIFVGLGLSNSINFFVKVSELANAIEKLGRDNFDPSFLSFLDTNLGDDVLVIPQNSCSLVI